MKTPTIEDLVAAYAAGKSIRYQTETGFSELTTQKAGCPKGNPSYGFRHSSHQTEGKSLAFLTDSPEQSIRRALTEPRPGLGFRVLEIWDKVAETLPAPPAPKTIPLGENVTRSGLRARVLANDLPDDRFPVGYSLPNGSLVKTNRAGSYLNSETKHDLDLVGHRHHEVKAPEDTKLEDLRRWKAKMKPLLAALNLPEIAKEIGETGAMSTAREILPYIVELKAKLEKAKEGLTPAERNEAGSLLDAVKHCWSQMPADLAFNDLLMRRTAPQDWTLENLKLAKRANHYLNEL